MIRNLYNNLLCNHQENTITDYIKQYNNQSGNITSFVELLQWISVGTFHRDYSCCIVQGISNLCFDYYVGTSDQDILLSSEKRWGKVHAKTLLNVYVEAKTWQLRTKDINSWHNSHNFKIAAKIIGNELYG